MLRRNSSKIPDILILLFLVVLVFLVMLPASPANRPIASRDSGVFQYIGSRILEGEVPYRDIWDHKPPVIYYINSLSLLLSGGSQWGIWIIEVIILFVSSIICLRILEEIFDLTSAIVGTSIYLLSVNFVLQGGNYTEEYALFFHWCALALVYVSEKKGRYSWRGYLIGILGGLAFFTKQTSIGFFLALILFLLIRNRIFSYKIKILRDIGIILSGAATAAGVILSYFALMDSLKYLWDASITYNYFYPAKSLVKFPIQSVIDSVLTGFDFLSPTNLPAFALAGWGIGLGYLLLRRNYITRRDSILILAIINLPIELILVSSTGRDYGHYYLALLPSLTILAGFLVYVLVAGLHQLLSPDGSKKVRLFSSLVIFGAFLLTQMPAFVGYIDTIKTLRQVLPERKEAIELIMELTSEEDSVLIWGAESEINFHTQRPSPTRFVYQYPLYEDGYTNLALVEEFMEDIIQNQPRLIIDTRTEDMPFLDFELESPRINELSEVILAQYSKIKSIGDWDVYINSLNP